MANFIEIGPVVWISIAHTHTLTFIGEKERRREGEKERRREGEKERRREGEKERRREGERNHTFFKTM
jgi:hypothetical protein